MLQHIEVCCSIFQNDAEEVLQCIAVCCRDALQCVAVSSSTLQGVALCCSVLQRRGCSGGVAVCCSVLQCVASKNGCCSVLQCVAVCCSVLQCNSTFVIVFEQARFLTKCLPVCCSVLQCFAVCCSVCCSVLQHLCHRLQADQAPRKVSASGIV